MYSFIIRRYTLVQIIIPITWYVILVKFFGVSHCEGMNIFPHNMTLSDEAAEAILPGSSPDKPNLQSPRSSPELLPKVPVTLPSITQKRDDLPSFLSFIKPSFEPEKEVYSILNNYISLCRTNESNNALNIVLNSFPSIENSEIFTHPIIKPFPNSPLTYSDRVINHFHESYYLNVEERKDICYILTIFKLYAACAHDHLTTMEARAFINQLTDQQLSPLIIETLQKLERYVSARS